MKVFIIKIDNFRSNSTKVNDDYDMIRIVLDMDIMDYNRFKKVLLNNEIELLADAWVSL